MFQCLSHCVLMLLFLGFYELSIQNQELPMGYLWVNSYCQGKKDLEPITSYHCSCYFPQRGR